MTFADYKYITNKIKLGKKLTKVEQFKYHKFKRDTAHSITIGRPDLNDNDVRQSAMYHNNVLQRLKGNKKYFKKNDKLFDMAKNYAVNNVDKPLKPRGKKVENFRI